MPQENPGRMALLVTLFLVLINIFNNITTNSPNTKSLTSISLWIVICIIFVYGSLLEYGSILLYRLIISDLDFKIKRFMIAIDISFLIASIISFLLFNIIFWML